MRVAYLCTDPGIPYGGTKGASVHVGHIVAALADEGAAVLLLAAALAPGARPPSAAVTAELLPGPGKGASAADRVAAGPELTSWLVERLRRFRADVLYERVALHSAAGTQAARRLGIPHLVELNAPLVQEAAAYRRLHEPAAAERLERETIAGADLVLAVSRPLAAHASARGARAVEVLPNAVDARAYRSAEPAAARPGAAPVAVFAGTLRPWHGIATIREAWRLLGPAAPALLVVGDGPGRALLEQAGAQVTGAVPPGAVPAALATATIGLAPYTADGPAYFSPLKVFEYLAAGLAVVAADLPGIRDVVGDEAALLVPPGDAVALAATVTRLGADPVLAARLGRAGQRLVLAEHTWDRRARRILELAAALRARAGVTT